MQVTVRDLYWHGLVLCGWCHGDVVVEKLAEDGEEGVDAVSVVGDVGVGDFADDLVY